MRNTPNYNLPQYEGTDKFTKEVLNDAFSKLDKAIDDLQETFNTTSTGGALTTQEVINARNGKQNLKERIDEIDEQYKDIVTNKLPTITGQLESKTKYITPEQFGAKGDGVTDDTQAFKKLIEYISQLQIYVYDGYTLKDCTNINIIFGGKYAISEKIVFPNVYGLVIDNLKIRAIGEFNGECLLDFSGVSINCVLSNCNIDGNLKTSCINNSAYALANVITNCIIHHFKIYGLKFTTKGHELRIMGCKIYQYTWGEFVNTTPTLPTGKGIIMDATRHDNRLSDNIFCYCKENLIDVAGGTNTFVNCHFYNGAELNTRLLISGSYNEFIGCYFDGTYLDIAPYNNIKNCLFLTAKVTSSFITLTSDTSNAWKFSLTSITGNKFKATTKVDTPIISNGFDITSLKANIYDNVFDNVTPFSSKVSSAYNVNPYDKIEEKSYQPNNVNPHGYWRLGDFMIEWGQSGVGQVNFTYSFSDVPFIAPINNLSGSVGAGRVTNITRSGFTLENAGLTWLAIGKK